jgi:membrane-bound serine protease (ClpP class)
VLLALAVLALILLPSPWGLFVVAGALVFEVAELALWRRFLRRYRLRTGPETLVGELATVVAVCDPDGRVRVRGELWNAHSSETAAVGESVRIAAIDGLTLEVERDRADR